MRGQMTGSSVDVRPMVTILVFIISAWLASSLERSGMMTVAAILFVSASVFGAWAMGRLSSQTKGRFGRWYRFSAVCYGLLAALTTVLYIASKTTA